MATFEAESAELESLRNVLDGIVNVTTANLVRAELGIELNFEHGLPYFERMILLFKVISESNLEGIPITQLQSVKSHAGQVKQQIDRILEFKAAGSSNPVNERDALIAFFRDQYDSYFNALYPIITYIRVSNTNLEHYEQEARMSLKNLESTLESALERGNQAAATAEEKLREAETILNHIRQASAETGVTRHANLFSQEATSHGETASKWLFATVLMALLTVVVTILYSTNVNLSKNPQPVELVQVFGSKLMVLSVMYYMLVWAARNYGAHRHNFVVNKHRQNALNTFEAFVKAAEDADTKNAVLLQATQTIFSSQASGYILKEGDTESPNKVIEIMRSVNASSK